MLLYRAQGAVLALLGLGSLPEAWRITRDVRQGANFDAVGPDRYLLALGVLMLLVGTWMAWRPPADDATGPAPPHVGATFFLTMAMLAALAAAMPYLGFPIASFVFMTVMFHRFGGWSWMRSTGASLVVAAVFYIAFIRVADVPLPDGYLTF